jgi:hypothetical protein
MAERQAEECADHAMRERDSWLELARKRGRKLHDVHAIVSKALDSDVHSDKCVLKELDELLRSPYREKTQ